MSIVYVITWRHFDGSGSGAVSVHSSEADAEKMLALLQSQNTGRFYAIEAVPSGVL